MIIYNFILYNAGYIGLVASGYFDNNYNNKLDRIGSDIDLSSMTVSSPMIHSIGNNNPSNYRIPSPLNTNSNIDNHNIKESKDIPNQLYTIGIINANEPDKTSIHSTSKLIEKYTSPNSNKINDTNPLQPMNSILAQKLLESLPDAVMRINKTTNINMNDSILSTPSTIVNSEYHHHNNGNQSDTTLSNVLSSSELSSKASSNNDSPDHTTPLGSTDTSDEDNDPQISHSSSDSLYSSMDSNLSYLPVNSNNTTVDKNKNTSSSSASSENIGLSLTPNPVSISLSTTSNNNSSVKNLIQSSSNNLLSSTNTTSDPMLNSLKRPRGSSNFVFSGSFDLTTSQGSFDLTSSSSTTSFINGLASPPSLGNSLFNTSTSNINVNRSNTSISSNLSPLQAVLQHNLRQSGMQNTNPLVISSVPSSSSSISNNSTPTSVSNANSSMLNSFAMNRGISITNNEDVATQMAAVAAGRILPGSQSTVNPNTITSSAVAAISVSIPESLSARIAANMNKSNPSLLRTNSNNRLLHSTSSSNSLHPNTPSTSNHHRSRGLSEDMMLLSASGNLNEYNNSLLNFSSSNNSAGAAPSICTTLTELNQNNNNNLLTRGSSNNSILSSTNLLHSRHNQSFMSTASFPDNTFDQLNSSIYPTNNSSSFNSGHKTNHSSRGPSRLRHQHNPSTGNPPLSRSSSSLSKSVRPIVRDIWEEPFDQIDGMVDNIEVTNIVLPNQRTNDNSSISDSDDSSDDADTVESIDDLDDELQNIMDDNDDNSEPELRVLPISNMVSARQLTASPLTNIQSSSYGRNSAIGNTNNSQPSRITESTPINNKYNSHNEISIPLIPTVPSSTKKKGAPITVPTSTYQHNSTTVSSSSSTTNVYGAVTPKVYGNEAPYYTPGSHDNTNVSPNITTIPISATIANRNLELENAGITLANGYGVLSITETMMIDEVLLPVVPRVRGWIGAYPPAPRYERLQRFFAKRDQRVWEKTVKYDVRKSFADSRLRVKGRFVKKEDEALLRDFMQLL